MFAADDLRFRSVLSDSRQRGTEGRRRVRISTYAAFLFLLIRSALRQTHLGSSRDLLRCRESMNNLKSRMFDWQSELFGSTLFLVRFPST